MSENGSLVVGDPWMYAVEVAISLYISHIVLIFWFVV